jgi:hypothetical protein
MGTLLEVVQATHVYELRSSVPAEDTISVHVQTLAGSEVLEIQTNLCAAVSDVKAEIQEHFGHMPRCQWLVFGETLLADSDAMLKDIGITHRSKLTLVVGAPLGQSCLPEPNGKKTQFLQQNPGMPFPKELFSEFQFKSWQAASEADNKGDGVDWNDRHWPKLGVSGLDLYWTTRSDGCRYEYWSSDFCGSEYGVLVRIDAHSMTGIGQGSDDGIELLDEFVEEFGEDDAVNELIHEGWPLVKPPRIDDDFMQYFT